MVRGRAARFVVALPPSMSDDTETSSSTLEMESSTSDPSDAGAAAVDGPGGEIANTPSTTPKSPTSKLNLNQTQAIMPVFSNSKLALVRGAPAARRSSLSTAPWDYYWYLGFGPRVRLSGGSSGDTSTHAGLGVSSESMRSQKAVPYFLFSVVGLTASLISVMSTPTPASSHDGKLQVAANVHMLNSCLTPGYILGWPISSRLASRLMNSTNAPIGSAGSFTLALRSAPRIIDTSVVLREAAACVLS